MEESGEDSDTSSASSEDTPRIKVGRGGGTNDANKKSPSLDLERSASAKAIFHAKAKMANLVGGAGGGGSSEDLAHDPANAAASRERKKSTPLNVM